MSRRPPVAARWPPGTASMGAVNGPSGHGTLEDDGGTLVARGSLRVGHAVHLQPAGIHDSDDATVPVKLDRRSEWYSGGVSRGQDHRLQRHTPPASVQQCPAGEVQIL